ncbi:hypothetical protein [Salipiger bermudensis]|uniref:hypothetical protein n=1 Tax=Salipiger bermudensis TaxID=344736 RepID=UPI001A8D0A8A|nr:hypothetical protein [Salipiger bermudensis]MBN9677022.1 hypothetical protein [Salipiger bermudensis]
MHPVDELHHLRREMSKLKTRADALRHDLLERGAPRRSNAFEVRITTTRRRTFLKDRLPPEILEDPRYWSVNSTQTLQVVALADEPDLFEKDADDFEVIERWSAAP